MTTIPLAPPSLAGSSDRPGDSGRAVRPPPARFRARRQAPPYLVLLRAGFCLPPVLPRARCALTAPFHPYPRRRAVYFLCHFPSGCPDRALPGALPCGVRTFLPPAPFRASADGRLSYCELFMLTLPAGRAGKVPIPTRFAVRWSARGESRAVLGRSTQSAQRLRGGRPSR